MKINLFFLCDNIKYGGFVTYTAHLARGFVSMGHRPVIWKAGNKTSTKPRKFGEGMVCYTASYETALSLAKNELCIIVCQYMKHHRDIILMLAKNNVPIVLHDPTEFNDDLFNAIRNYKPKVICIRKSNVLNLSQHGIKSYFIPHPYSRFNFKTKPLRHRHACSMSRLDFDKHIETIIEANNLLPSDKRIKIYGAENRLYTHHNLDANYKGWRDNYCGQFALYLGASAILAAKHKFLVDMSAIKGDGDGTQYTFLEAFDAGTVLVVSEKWFTGKTSVLNHLENCIVANGAADLAAYLNKMTDGMAEIIAKNAKEILKQHTPSVIIPQYLDILK